MPKHRICSIALLDEDMHFLRSKKDGSRDTSICVAGLVIFASSAYADKDNEKEMIAELRRVWKKIVAVYVMLLMRPSTASCEIE